MSPYNGRMVGASYTLDELSEATGIEPRTIRSYIERGLLPGAESRGRGATYCAAHLSRLKVIQALRRARPNVALNDVRIVLQQLSGQQIDELSHGKITAAVAAMDEPWHQEDEGDSQDAVDERGSEFGIDWEVAGKLTGVERLVGLLREVAGPASAVPRPKSEEWTRIPVTPDVELSVRGKFHESQVAVFRDLAALLRCLLEQSEATQEEGHR